MPAGELPDDALAALAQTPVPAGGTLASSAGTELVDAVLKQGDPESVDRLVALRTGDPEFSYLLALKLLEAGFPDHAERAARNAVRHGPKDARYYERLGSILWACGKVEEGIGTLRIACELAGSWTYPQERLTMLLAERGRAL